jgi:hypothetical protein
MQCNICSSPSALFSYGKILGKCQACGFVQCETPYWLDECYSDAITKSDTGLVWRNNLNAKISSSIIRIFYDSHGRFLDYGGGYGLFVRLMRDAGYDFYWHDRFCANLFARGFKADLSAASGRYELVTAFEVFEHLPEPMKAFDEIFSFSRSVLFTTVPLPATIPKPGEWWYYGLEHGQHVSFYTLDTLRYVAKHFGVNFYRASNSMFMFTPKRVSQPVLRLFSFEPMARLAAVLRCRKGLMVEDNRRISRELDRSS